LFQFYKNRTNNIITSKSASMDNTNMFFITNIFFIIVKPTDSQEFIPGRTIFQH
ncbi:hypothetical protein L9F63_023506, partial [Diploptera punctata]